MTEAGERRRAEEAKQRLQATLGDVQARLAPAALVREAKDGLVAKSAEVAHRGVMQGTRLAERGAAEAKARPGVALGAGAAALLLILRRPLWRLIRRRHTTDEATHDDTTGYEHQRAPTRRKDSQ